MHPNSLKTQKEIFWPIDHAMIIVRPRTRAFFSKSDLTESCQNTHECFLLVNRVLYLDTCEIQGCGRVEPVPPRGDSLGGRNVLRHLHGRVRDAAPAPNRQLFRGSHHVPPKRRHRALQAVVRPASLVAPVRVGRADARARAQRHCPR